MQSYFPPPFGGAVEIPGEGCWGEKDPGIFRLGLALNRKVTAETDLSAALFNTLRFLSFFLRASLV